MNRRTVRAPNRGLRRSAGANNPHVNLAETIMQTPLAGDRPPIVEKGIQRPPHRHPADDQHAFAHQRRQPGFGPDQACDMRGGKDQGQKGKTDAETDQAAAQKLMKIA